MIYWLIGLVLLPLCAALTWLILRRPVRQVVEDLGEDRARRTFRTHRERLELEFLQALAIRDPDELTRWEDARWRDEVVWARDRVTRRLLALVAVDFEPTAEELIAGSPPRVATTIFEYRGSRWVAEGRHLDAIGPQEAFRRHKRLLPVVLPQTGP